MTYDHMQAQADREQERLQRERDFHAAHPEFALLGDLHPVLRQAFVPLVQQQPQQPKEGQS